MTISSCTTSHSVSLVMVVSSVRAADDAEDGGGGAGHQDDGVERGQADLQAGAGRGGARVLGQ